MKSSLGAGALVAVSLFALSSCSTQDETPGPAAVASAPAPAKAEAKAEAKAARQAAKKEKIQQKLLLKQEKLIGKEKLGWNS